MKKILVFTTIIVLLISCGNDNNHNVDVSDITATVKVRRFEQAFFEASPANLSKLKRQFPLFFSPATPDSIWIAQMTDTLNLELFHETQKIFPAFDKEKIAFEELFKHVKYYYPSWKEPEVNTLMNYIIYPDRMIYASKFNKLLVSIDNYLGEDTPIYAEVPAYMRAQMKPSQLISDASMVIGEQFVTKPYDTHFLAKMIYAGKKLYLNDLFIPNKTDAEKINYTQEQIQWAKDNEPFIWEYYVGREMLYSNDKKLDKYFLELAPFSKFFLEVDAESPGRIGQWIGWQIVRAYMAHNPDVPLDKMLQMEAEEIFKKSKYKPRKVE
jgi:gliding motility-associated lipoprotein GldB